MDTNFQQVDANKFLVTISNADSLNHVVVFLTGLIPLPTGTASCIFFSLPDPNAPPAWHYLGHLTNEKPSAIYKLSNLTVSHIRNNQIAVQSGQMAFNYSQAPVLHVAQIGISVEPIDSVLQMVPAVETSASNINTFTEFINKTVGNLYNYCSSFSRTTNELIGNPFQASQPSSNTQFVPLSSIQNWYENYTRRLSNDQNFWKTLN